MKLLWTFAKFVLALAILGPLAIIVGSTALGLLSALVGLAMVTLRFAIIGLVLWGAYRLVMAVFGPKPEPVVRELRPAVDPYYEAAKRELDQELGEASR